MSSSLLASIVRQCDQTPDAPALTSPSATWTYGTLGRYVAARSEEFGHRMRPRAVAGIVTVPAPESVVHVLAASAAGRTPLLVPAGLPSWEERAALNESGAAYLVARGMFLPLGDQPPPGEGFPEGLMQLTSGSLGPSRPAFRTWEGIDEEVRSITHALSLTAADTVMVTSSLGHSYAFMAGILAPLSVGAHVVISPAGAANPRDLGVSIVLGMAAVYQDWMGRYGPDAVKDVRLAFSAGAPLPDGLYNRVLRNLGIAIRQDYGTTETGTISMDAGPTPDPLSTGTILPHLEVLVAEGDGQDGEIDVRGTAVAAGYVSEGQLVPVTDAAGWYHTLDTGTLGPDRRLRVTGRRRLPLQVGTRRIDPREVEEAVLRIPGIREAAAVQVRSNGNASLKLVVAGSVRQDDLERWSQEHLGFLGEPVVVEVREALPRSPAGKLLRKYLL
jgi:acyl-CoA synthetase (AMP-forming)/AMP-acid ligase II